MHFKWVFHFISTSVSFNSSEIIRIYSVIYCQNTSFTIVVDDNNMKENEIMIWIHELAIKISVLYTPKVNNTFLSSRII